MSLKITKMKNCSYCQDSGHTINNCMDPSIDLLLQEFHEYMAFDLKCKFKYKYIRYICSLLSLSELRIIGYHYNLNMSKMSREDFTSEIIDESSRERTMYDEIISKMNLSELEYFYTKIANNSKEWNSRKYSLTDIKKRAGIQSSENDSLVKNTLKTNKENTYSHDDDYMMPLLFATTPNEDDNDNTLESIFKFIYIFIFGITAFNVYMSQ